MQESSLWLMLLRIPGIGSGLGRKLLDFFGDIEHIFAASFSKLKQLKLNDEICHSICKPNWDLIEPDLAWMQQRDHYLLTLSDPNYPVLLKEIPDPPLVLYVAGNTQILSCPQLAIVGSRNPTYTGRDNAYQFAKNLVQMGFIITSGLAIGIDSEGHKGALAAGGKTIAVLGTGLSHIYPARNKVLARQILAKGGALISEFPVDTLAKPQHFPQRNRIISGLSVGLLVVEAATHSGSLISARLAVEQNREVFAIPGSIHNPLSRGCHILLRDGAKLVETAQDIVEELPLVAFHHPHASFCHSRANGGCKQNSLAPEQQKLLEYIEFDVTPVDLIIERSGLRACEVSAQLLILELEGYIKSTIGGYIKVTSNA